jgi:hypothetical protein
LIIIIIFTVVIIIIIRSGSNIDSKSHIIQEIPNTCRHILSDKLNCSLKVVTLLT